MGFFKSLGSKLKRVISIKNLTNVATGNFSALGKDVLRVATTEVKKDSNGVTSIVSNGLSKTPVVMPQTVSDILDAQGQKTSKQLVSALATNDSFSNATTFLTKAWLQSQWLKYKNWLIGLGVAIIMFLVVNKTMFSGKSRKSGRR